MTMELTSEKALIFRIMHIDNVPWMLANGLHCSKSNIKDPAYRGIGDPELIDKRSRSIVPVAPNGTLGDYVPFYFTPFSPMLLNIKTGFGGIQTVPMSDIVILVTSLHILKEGQKSFVFTDGHAYFKTARFFNDIADLGNIDWKLLNARDFRRDLNDPGKFERYQAEALVHQHLSTSMLSHIICYDGTRGTHLNRLLKEANINLKAIVKPSSYFNDTLH